MLVTRKGEIILIEIKNLTKRYGAHAAVDGLTFTVEKGEICGLLGPNGAGKSTTMNMITGYISATDGTASVDGLDIFDEPQKARAKIGYLPEIPPLYTDMTPYEYLIFVAELKGVKRAERHDEVERVMEKTGVSDVAERLIKNLSKGYRQRVGFAGALVGNPEVIILDEPTVGLDPKQIIEMRELIKTLASDHTVLLSSHIMQEISAVCDKVVIISKGKLVAYDTPENLSADTQRKRTLKVTALDTQGEVNSVLKQLKDVENIELLPCEEEGAVTAEITTTEDKDLRAEVSSALSKAGCAVLSMKTEVLSLEDVFLALTSENQPEASEEIQGEKQEEEAQK
jgi:ABC-2 type transport system ATP-binding protein